MTETGTVSNEIELIVSVRRQGDRGVKRRGDVITCRLAGGKWGSQELKVHQVVTWPGNNASVIELQSAALALAILNKKKEWGEPNPTVDFPFCEIVTEPIEDENGVQIISPDGEILKELKKSEGVITANINPQLSKDLRFRIPSLKSD